MTHITAWLQAARFPSQLYLLLPVWLGQLWAENAGYPLNSNIFWLALLFALIDQLYIVFANDYADQEADALNIEPTLFSGGSRVLVEGKLSPTALLRAAQISALGCLAIGTILSTVFKRPGAIVLTLVALGLLWAYSFWPIRASYRGFGVFLQTIGIAGVLPLFGFYVQAGSLENFPWVPLAVLALSQLSCAMATALPDIEGDTRGEKNTLAVKLGHRKSQLFMAFALLTAGILQWLTLEFAPGDLNPFWIWIPVGLALLAGIIPDIRAASSRLTGVATMTIAGALSIELIYILAIL